MKAKNYNTEELKANRRLACAIAWVQVEKLFVLGEERISINGKIMNRLEWTGYKRQSIHKSLYYTDLKACGYDNKEHNRRNWIDFAAKDKERLEMTSGSANTSMAHLYRDGKSPFFYTRRWYKKGGLKPATYEKHAFLRREIEKADLHEKWLRDSARFVRKTLQNERLLEQYRKELEDS